MRSNVFSVIAALSFGALVMCPDANAESRWQPLQPTDIVTFLIPAQAPQPVVISDYVVFVGGPILEIDISGCGFGTRAVQQYIIVDPSGRRSPSGGGIIATTTTDPIRPGTLLESLNFDTECTLGSVDGPRYIKYQGTVPLK